MKKLLKSYKTEINPTPKQKQIINRTIGVCRYVYNFYLAHNQEIYKTEKRFVSGIDFSKWINNEFIPENPDFHWIKEVSSKSVKQSIMNAEKAFKNFFKGKSRFPKFKKKAKSDVKIGGNVYCPLYSGTIDHLREIAEEGKWFEKYEKVKQERSVGGDNKHAKHNRRNKSSSKNS